MKMQMVAAFAGLVLLLTASTSHAEQSIEQVYGVYCVQCHGLNRNGTGINVPSLSVKPRDHTDAKSMGDSSDEELTKAITEGGLAVNKSVLMPTWGHVLSEEQIKGLVKYLRQVCKCGT